MCIWVKMKNRPNKESNHESRDLEYNVLSITPWLYWKYRNNIGVECCPCVKSRMDMEFLL